MQGLVSWLTEVSDISIEAKCSSKEGLLEVISDLRPDVVLLDLHAPGELSIEEVIDSIIARGAKIVVFSAENRLYFVKLCLDRGVSAYLLKSEHFGRLTDAIRKAAAGEKNIVSSELAPKDDRLTEAEIVILRLLAQGNKYEQIADARSSRPETVRKQCDRLLIKLGLNSREELISWANKNGFGAA